MRHLTFRGLSCLAALTVDERDVDEVAEQAQGMKGGRIETNSAFHWDHASHESG